MLSVWDSAGFLIYCGCVALVLGAVFGSFLNCAAWRLAHGESVFRGRSHCTACGHVLGAWDLIPVFSWLFLKGCCRYCGGKIPKRYPITEGAFALLTLLCLLRFDLSWLCLRNWVFLCCLFCMTLTDLDSMVIPDSCLVIAAANWLAFLPMTGGGWVSVRNGLLAALVFGGGLLALSLVMDRHLGKESLGGGDIKLFGIVGLYLGFAGTLFAVIFSCIFGLAMGRTLRNMRGGEGQFPFGPAIALASSMTLLYGEPLINWYLSLF